MKKMIEIGNGSGAIQPEHVVRVGEVYGELPNRKYCVSFVDGKSIDIPATNMPRSVFMLLLDKAALGIDTL